MSAYGQPRFPPRAVPIWFGRMRLSLGQNGFGLALCGIVLLAAGLRVYALDHQSLWTDEIFSLMTTDPALTLHQFWDLVLADTHPPIYYLVLRLSSAAFGQSEIAARVPSTFFGVLTVCGAAILSSSSLSRTSRLAFLLFLGVSPGAVWYAREARSRRSSPWLASAS
jgi:mannosyltransferase